jgi:pyruvate dehydrogenase E1 component alpha subunit
MGAPWPGLQRITMGAEVHLRAAGNAFAAPWPTTPPASMMQRAMTLATTTSVRELLRDVYEQMVLIRAFETESERQYKAARIGGYCHLASGQEAAIVGAMHALEDDDLLVTGYRCHGFALARGVSPEAVMSELFGRRHGCAHGRGGSMHLLDVDRGFFGGWGIVAGQLPVATGLALALVRQGKQQAVLCELGDGAVNMGAWHESLNLAALWSLPVVFLVVNNEYAMGTSVERASAEPELYKRACAFRMHGERVDGDDFEAVAESAGRLLRRAREEREPAVLEALTYRFRGHSVADAGLSYRTKDEVDAWMGRDPIAVTRARLLDQGVSEEDLTALDHAARERVEAAVAYATADEAPPVAQLAAGMHAPGSVQQFERMRPGSPFGEVDLVFDAGLGR